MTFNPHTVEDRAEMLEAVGVSSAAELFASVSVDVRFPNLSLPPALTEMEAAARLNALARQNFVADAGDSYLGAGAYRHYIPATVGQILARGEFYTAYTPYQPEVAQGTLQVIYEFQTLVAELLGMEVANASMYDGATALAEGALIAISATRRKDRIVVSGTVHPAYRDVLRTYLSGTNTELIELPVPTDGFVTTVDDFRPYLDDRLACLIVQYPNFFGGIEDIEAVAAAAHEAGALLTVATSPVPLGLLKSPGELGADIVAAEGQSLGVPQSYGGPYVGLLATQKSHLRQLPGRLAGVTQDSEGKRGFVLTLQTREQHIRREKATSNICTNQGLMATAATVYMASVGPEGFREVATACYRNAHYLAASISALPGFEPVLDAEFFHEFVVRCPRPAETLNQRLAEERIVGGYGLGAVDPALEDYMLLCATELNSRAGIDRLVTVLAS